MFVEALPGAECSVMLENSQKHLIFLQQPYLHLELTHWAWFCFYLSFSELLICHLSEAEQLRRELEDERVQQTLLEERHKQ